MSLSKQKEEKEKRVLDVQQKAIQCIGKQDLTRGWQCWLDASRSSGVSGTSERCGSTDHAAAAGRVRLHVAQELEEVQQAANKDAQAGGLLRLRASRPSSRRRVRRRLKGAVWRPNSRGSARWSSSTRRRSALSIPPRWRSSVSAREPAKGWTPKASRYREKQRLMRALKSAAGGCCVPQLAAAVKHWLRDWEHTRTTSRR